MFKVNLETELLKQPASKVSASELLYIQEYDRLGPDVSNNEILSRIGINKAAEEGKSISTTKENLLRQAKDFNLDKVFHISQIESLCKKYYLRFLPSALFNGSIDSALPDKIATFEATYGVKCKSIASADPWRFDRDREKGSNTFIAAPASSFKLEEKPKDPLLFYKINDEYYYLIHKWGNDLSLVRRFYNLLSSKLITWFLIIPITVFLFSNIHFIKGALTISSQVKVSLGVFMIISAIANLIIGEGGMRLLPKNNITSRFIKE